VPGRRKRSTAHGWLFVSVLLGGVVVAGIFLLRILREQGLWLAGVDVPAPPSDAVRKETNQGPDVRRQASDSKSAPLPLSRALPPSDALGPTVGDSLKPRKAVRDDPVDGDTQPLKDSSVDRTFGRLSKAQKEIVRHILVALSERDATRAGDLIAELNANGEVVWPEDVIHSLQLLHQHVEYFWEGIEKARDQLKSGDTITYNGREAVVVDVTDDHIELRSDGTKRIIELNSLPGWLVTELANRWFDNDDPANWVTRGSYEFVSPDGNLAKARSLWTKASDAGEPAVLLLPLLSLISPPRSAN
jgi:hypothetical protein